MSIVVDVRFDRVDKVYREGEEVSGVVSIFCKAETRHEGVLLDMDGAVQMQLSGKNLGLLESFSPTAKPLNISSHQEELAKAGRILPGKTDIAFRFPLRSKLNNRSLLETYHGVFVAVQYVVKCEVKRSFPNKSVHKVAEFLVESKKDEQTIRATSKPIAFTINRESVQSKERAKTLPQFSITGRLDSCACLLSQPLSGEVTLHKTEIPLKSIELQLIRIEILGTPDGHTRDATEIQTLQIAEGSIAKGLPVPIYMVFPRLFVCPSITTPNFTLEFELNLVFLFANGLSVVENFPISLHRY